MGKTGYGDHCFLAEILERKDWNTQVGQLWKPHMQKSCPPSPNNSAMGSGLKQRDQSLEQC